MSSIVVDVLLGLAAASAVVCCAGVLAMRATLDRLHFAAAATTVPTICVLAAVLVREHLSSGGMTAIAAVALLFLLNPVLVIATARAVRRVEGRE